MTPYLLSSFKKGKIIKNDGKKACLYWWFLRETWKKCNTRIRLYFERRHGFKPLELYA